MHEFEGRFRAHHYAPTSRVAHAQCATIRMNTVSEIFATPDAIFFGPASNDYV